MSPLHSANAFLQSIIGAPLFSRSSFPIWAVISLISFSSRLAKARRCSRWPQSSGVASLGFRRLGRVVFTLGRNERLVFGSGLLLPRGRRRHRAALDFDQRASSLPAPALA